MAKANKSIAKHPRSGREMNIEAAIYEPFKAAILQSLQKSKGKTFTELSDDVVKIIHKKMPGFTKSIPWYTITIRLDLETKGIVETFTEKGKRLNRLTSR
jgi:TRAP-type mannitol/chloroaromatic compound transport system substrate-binding protein